MTIHIHLPKEYPLGRAPFAWASCFAQIRKLRDDGIAPGAHMMQRPLDRGGDRPRIVVARTRRG